MKRLFWKSYLATFTYKDKGKRIFHLDITPKEVFDWLEEKRNLEEKYFNKELVIKRLKTILECSGDDALMDLELLICNLFERYRLRNKK